MNSYTDNLRKIKSLLIVTSLQKKIDIKAFKNLEKLKIDLDWDQKSNLMIDEDIWEYIIKTKVVCITED